MDVFGSGLVWKNPTGTKVHDWNDLESGLLTRPAQKRKSVLSLMGDTSCRDKADNHRESESLNASGGLVWKSWKTVPLR